jgi:ribose transport system permease protein
MARQKLKRIFARQEINLLIIIILLVILISIIQPKFIVPNNLISLLLIASNEAIVAIGMTLLLISKGFDLSVGSVSALTAAMTGLFMVKIGIPVPLAIILGLSVSAAVGFMNGVLIQKVGINPLVATIGTMSITRASVYIFTRGMGVPVLPDSFNVIGKAKIGSFPLPVIIMIILVVGSDLFLRNSKSLRKFFYIGGSEESARLAGINIDKIRIIGYITTAVLAGFSGLIVAARFSTAQPTMGSSLNIKVIIACVIGGCSLNGGEGTIFGSFLGVLLLGIILNAFNMLGISVFWENVILGSVLLFGVVFEAAKTALENRHRVEL